MKTVAYVRVSSKEQNLARQIQAMHELGISDKYIYEDKDSAKDLDRVGYIYMKKQLEAGDTLVVKSLDRISRNKKNMRKEWEWFADNKINIRVLDMPILNRSYEVESELDESVNDLIRNLVFEIMTWTDEEERARTLKRQREGIAIAKAEGRMGRNKLQLSTLSKEKKIILESNYDDWKNKKIKGVEFMKILDLKKTSFYKIMKEYEEKISAQ